MEIIEFCRGFSAEDCTYEQIDEQIRVNCPAFKIAVDQHDIFSIDGFQLARIKDSDALKADRASVDGFVLLTNTIWYAKRSRAAKSFRGLLIFGSVAGKLIF